MAEITVQRHFDAPPERVWAILADFEHAADRLEAVKSLELLTDGPVGRGTRFRETRLMFGKEAVEEMEITEWDPPHRYTVECDSCGVRFRSVIACHPEGGGSVVEMSTSTTPNTLMAKIISAVMGGMMKKQCAKAFDKDLDDLKRAAESDPTPPPPSVQLA